MALECTSSLADMTARHPSRITERLLSGRKESNQTNKQKLLANEISTIISFTVVIITGLAQA